MDSQKEKLACNSLTFARHYGQSRKPRENVGYSRHRHANGRTHSNTSERKRFSNADYSGKRFPLTKEQHGSAPKPSKRSGAALAGTFPAAVKRIRGKCSASSWMLAPVSFLNWIFTQGGCFLNAYFNLNFCLFVEAKQRYTK